MVDNVIESFTLPPAGTATLSTAFNMPDGLGSTPGSGFTITGLTRATDGTWWGANEGQSDSADTTYTPSLVHMTSDFSSVISEISVGTRTERSLQGLTYVNGNLWVASLSQNLAKEYDATTGNLVGSIGDVSVNGIAY